METSRVEAFSDGVFAIALTVLVLTIEAPDPRGDLARELVRLWPSYLPYALTVLVIGAVRVNHHAMIEHIAVVDWPMLFMNTIMQEKVRREALCCIPGAAGKNSEEGSWV